MSRRRIVFLVLMLGWMAGIFVFSSRTGGESTGDSYFVGQIVGEIFVPGFDSWSEEQQTAFAETIDHPVRKTAHAAEYAVLALLAAGVYIPGKRQNRKIFEAAAERGSGKRSGVRTGIFLPWLTAALYAATDEAHQLFVPGRSGQISDVILDSAGALAGVLVLAAARKLIKRRGFKIPDCT